MSFYLLSTLNETNFSILFVISVARVVLPPVLLILFFPRDSVNKNTIPTGLLNMSVFVPSFPADCHGQAAVTPLNQQRLDLAGPDFQSVLDIRSLLKTNTADEQLKDNKAGNCSTWEFIL